MTTAHRTTKPPQELRLFGGVHTSTGPNPELRFPGQWFQSETGLHQNWMRDYDPTLGRYIQADPLGLVDGASMYGYALQNPGRYVDFIGLASCTYSISTQWIICNSNNQSFAMSPNGVHSGREACRDNVECSDNENYGPTPPGEYNMRFSEKFGGSYWLDEGRLTRLLGGVEGRSEFFLHKGRVSFGCITVRPDHPDWDNLMDFLSQDRENTTTVVP